MVIGSIDWLMGAAKIPKQPASTVEATQFTPARKSGEYPSTSAPFSFSDAARVARPNRVNRNSAHSPMVTAMTMSTVAIDTQNELHVHLEFTTKVTFDRNFHPLDGLGNRGDLLIAQFTSPDVRVDIGGSKNFAADRKTNAINVWQ